MGELIDGQWCRTTPEATLPGGAFQRKPSIFRSWITPDGAPIDGTRGFPAKAGRYHLYVSLACPWAHSVQRRRQPLRMERRLKASRERGSALEALGDVPRIAIWAIVLAAGDQVPGPHRPVDQVVVLALLLPVQLRPRIAMREMQPALFGR